MWFYFLYFSTVWNLIYAFFFCFCSVRVSVWQKKLVLENYFSTALSKRENQNIHIIMSLSSEISRKFEIDKTITAQLAAIDKLSIDNLIELKKQIEFQLDGHIGQLEILENDGNSTNGTGNYLVDGFPRSDLDLISIRFVRRNIIMLKNDLEKLINILYEKLNNNSKLSSNKPIPQQLKSFILFSGIVKGSPSEKSGLKENDKLITINQLNYKNYKNLNDIKLILQSNLNKNVHLKILRESSGKYHDLILMPTDKWNGQGILGCRITEIST
ncbi:hypothetical protein TPHA_0I02360 [Tetrapisispora phaffii CBS 4417]|uniref:Probable 26S proteasome regulatory subunit p27 n=1 Tax=Tetrapisispora phaffii (strain ATCC 24235 / CBS 4417 / NBRC 1672 / NRRL Y-8282 / UCD 70-5) TaxID=1071381 RepID=G8BXW1_TETPH|nr:hypothetical protein TPHA_0I02360 [Tetrapisispora phaffii CBS 4417]CCE64739.1 hypothetical protein TPHA_0I02360 [Tetrapisispora phaffii CBS 4417]